MPFFDMDDATAHGTDEFAWPGGVDCSARPPDRRRTGDPVPPGPLDPAVGSLESFAAVIDALAAERGAPRAEIIRRMVEELENRIAVDRATIALLRRL